MCRLCAVYVPLTFRVQAALMPLMRRSRIPLTWELHVFVTGAAHERPARDMSAAPIRNDDDDQRTVATKINGVGAQRKSRAVMRLLAVARRRPK